MVILYFTLLPLPLFWFYGCLNYLSGLLVPDHVTCLNFLFSWRGNVNRVSSVNLQLFNFPLSCSAILPTISDEVYLLASAWPIWTKFQSKFALNSKKQYNKEKNSWHPSSVKVVKFHLIVQPILHSLAWTMKITYFIIFFSLHFLELCILY